MKLQVTLVKSPISSKPNHIRIVEALGLHKVHATKVFEDTPSIRGMLFKVKSSCASAHGVSNHKEWKTTQNGLYHSSNKVMQVFYIGFITIDIYDVRLGALAL